MSSQTTRTHIRKLNDLLVAQIAAGEVIESPVAVIKELTENSIDAKATRIEIFIKDFGFSQIQVRDNGQGISQEDLPLAIESFATSKISTVDDLHKIHSMGFRGEALGSLRAVSRLAVESITDKQKNAYGIYSDPGQAPVIEPVALEKGTRVIAKDLFFNVPVRREFHANRTKLKKQITDQVEKLGLAYPHVAISLNINGSLIFQLESKNTLSERIAELYSPDILNDILPVYYKDKQYELSGYISKFYFYKSLAGYQHLFVNNRSVHYKRLTGLLRNVYGELLPPGRFPVAFLFLNTNPAIIDVNIHPQKKEIKFLREEEAHHFMTNAIRTAIEGKGPLNISRLKKISSLPALQDTESAKNQNFSFLPEIPIQESNSPAQGPASVPLSQENVNVMENDSVQIPQQYHVRLFDTFILATSQEGVFLIDQHTAHERINYEYYLSALDTNTGYSQPLLTGIRLNLSSSEKMLMNKYRESLSKVGFETESLGPAGILLTAVPVYLATGQEEEAFNKALHLLEKHENLAHRELFDQLAKDLSCRHAIKKGESASLHDFSAIIDQLRKCKQPLRCPHGRPTLVFLNKEDIFSLFKRRA